MKKMHAQVWSQQHQQKTSHKSANSVGLFWQNVVASAYTSCEN